MSLLGQIYATPSRIKGVLQLFSRERGQRLKRESAEGLLSPESLLRGNDEDGKGPDMVAAVINECLTLGLLREDGESLLLSPDLPDAVRRYETIGSALPGVILDRVLDPSRDANQDLAAALAWFLSQDVLNAPGNWEEWGRVLVQQGLADVLRFNDTRYKMFYHWTPFLGLANRLAIPLPFEERLAPDPTDCLRRIVAELPVRDGERVTAMEFMQRVSARCPLFEGGAIRSAMQLEPKLNGRFLSSTTSHALLRLENEGVLRMEMLSDADALLLDDGVRPRPVSELVRLPISREVA